jgi:hypothetical protein
LRAERPARASLGGVALRLAVVVVGLAGCHTRGGLVLTFAGGEAGFAPDAGPADLGVGGASGDTAGIGGGAPDATGIAGTGDTGVVVATTYYISPDGSDSNPGTSQDAPWLTFPHAWTVLGPGSTLVLLDGTYTSGTTGLLQAYCGVKAANGTPGAPITVRALNERMAFILADGLSGPPIELSGCANWVLDGLHAEQTDVPSEKGSNMGDEPGSVVVLTRCTNVLARRMLGAHPNRYLTATVFVVAHAGGNVVIEESEALDFHYFGFHAYDSLRVTFRRDYAHSRDGSDAPGGQATAYPMLGDGGFLLKKSSFGIIENCIAEDVADGFTIRGNENAQGGRVQPQHDQLIGDIANGVTHAGFVLYSFCQKAGTNNVPAMPCMEGDQIVSYAVLSNDVSRGGTMGLSYRGGVNCSFSNLSVFDTTDTGISFSLDPINAGLTSNATERDSLVTAPAGTAIGVHSTGQSIWTVADTNVFGAAMPFVPRDNNHLMAVTEGDPQLGSCIVYVPASSPMKAAGNGANIVFQTVNGTLTSTKLWDANGHFPCGAIVTGLNDLPDLSCMDVGARLHVGAMGCAVP